MNSSVYSSAKKFGYGTVPVYPTIEGAVGEMVVYGGLVDWKSLCNKPDCIGNSHLGFVYLHFSLPLRSSVSAQKSFLRKNFSFCKAKSEEKNP